MSTLRNLSLVLLSGFGFNTCYADTGSVTARIHKKNGLFFVEARDSKGFTREYTVSNSRDHFFDLLRQDAKQITVKGIFVDKGPRTGSVELSEVGEEFADPLGIAGTTR